MTMQMPGWDATASRDPFGDLPLDPFIEIPPHKSVWDSSAIEVVGALNDLGIGAGWVIADTLRAFARDHPTAKGLGQLFAARQPKPNDAFRNLVVGTIAERLFSELCLAPLGAQGFTVRDNRSAHDNRDFTIEKDGVRLPVNVKVSATRFDSSKKLVDIEPDDCIGFSAYKAWAGAAEGVLFVSLVDHDLRKKVDMFMESELLDSHTRTVWELFSYCGGKDWEGGAKRAQDQFINDLFRRRGRELTALAGDAPQFRAISAQRVVDIQNENWTRNPGLMKRGMAGSQVHVSVARETTSWAGLVTMLLTKGVAGVIDAMTSTRMCKPGHGVGQPGL